MNISVSEATLSQFINSIKDVKNNYKRYDEWEQKQADDVAKKEYLSKTIDLPMDKVEITEAKARAVIRATDLLDHRSEDNCDKMSRITDMMTALALLPIAITPLIMNKILEKKGKTLTQKQNKLVITGVVSAVFLVGTWGTLWGHKKQKEASRIGRFQGKTQDLKNPKNFVIYTPEQIEFAKEHIKNKPKKTHKKKFFTLPEDIKQMSKDKIEYEKWRKQKAKKHDVTEKILNTDFSSEQLTQGEEDKEIILNIVKDINIKAEKYSEKAEKAFESLSIASFLGSILLGVGIKKATSKSIPTALTSAIVTGGIVLWGHFEQKDSASIGRYIKRKDILKNPKRLMVYTDEQLKLAENIKAPIKRKGILGRIGENFKFLKTYMEDKRNYKKYLKTEAKENKKFYQALKKTEVTEEQLKEAKHLQAKTFYTYDKMDEMSQRYAQDIETGTDIAKNAVSLGWALGGTAFIASIPILIKKGKIPLDKIAKFISNKVLNENSPIKKFIDKASAIISKNKNLKDDMNKGLLNKPAKKRFLENPEIKSIIKEGSNILTEMQEHKTIAEQFKKSAISRWFKNLFSKTPSNTEKAINKESVNLKDEKNNAIAKLYNDNSKTIISTILVSLIPASGVLFGVPFAFNSWLTGIQKKASKIGVMKAADEIDDPKLFVQNQN